MPSSRAIRELRVYSPLSRLRFGLYLTLYDLFSSKLKICCTFAFYHGYDQAEAKRVSKRDGSASTEGGQAEVGKLRRLHLVLLPLGPSFTSLLLASNTRIQAGQ